MMIRTLIRCACAFVGAALLTKCVSGTPLLSTEAAQRTGSLEPVRQGATLPGPLGPVRSRRSSRGHSWILPGAGKQWLLYTSDSDGKVNIYNYRVKTGKLYGQIAGFVYPYGQCIDASSDVYIVDYRASEVYEFAHGGTTPIAMATDEYGSPIGCAVDPTTGSVAVSNYLGTSGAGGVDIFAGGLSGKQTNYTNSSLYSALSPGYDPHGNLYFEGLAKGVRLATLFELAEGSGTLRSLTGLTIDGAASVQWDGSHIAVTDANYEGTHTTAIERITVSGSAVSVVRTTLLTDTCDGTSMDTFQPFINGTARSGNAIVSGNLKCEHRLAFWNYTKGGNPKRTIPANIAPRKTLGESVSPPVSP